MQFACEAYMESLWFGELNKVIFRVGEADNVPFAALWPKEIVHNLKGADVQFINGLALFAVRTNLPQVLEALLDGSVIDVNTAYSRGRRLIHIACALDCTDCVQVLVKKGANLSLLDDYKRLPQEYCRNLAISQLIEMAVASLNKSPKASKKGLFGRFRGTKDVRNTPELTVACDFSATTERRSVEVGMPPWTAVQRSSEVEKRQSERSVESHEDSPLALIEDPKELIAAIGRMTCELDEDFEEVVMRLRDLVLTEKKHLDSSALLQAAVQHGLKGVPLIIMAISRFGANVHRRCNGDTPLMMAVRGGLRSIADLLIVSFGSDPSTDESLQIAICETANPDLVVLLLDRGAHPCLTDSHSVFFDQLPEASAECVKLVQTRRDERTRWIAALSRQTAPGDFCVEVKADDLALSDPATGCFMLEWPAVMHSEVLYSAALSSLRFISKEKAQRLLNLKHPKSGRTVLAMSARMGLVALIQALLAAGANPGIADTSGLLPSHHAILSGHLSALSAIYDSDDALVGFDQALHLAISHDAIAIVREAYHRRQERIVRPALVEAALTANAEKLAGILEPSDAIDAVGLSSSGDSPLFLAVQSNATKLVAFLISRGVDICRHHPLSGDNVLHVAVRSKDKSLVDLFLSDTVDPKSRRCLLWQVNRLGQSALHVAAAAGSMELVEKLLLAGASPLLDEALGYLPITSPFESVQLKLERFGRDRLSTVLESLKAYARSRKSEKAKSKRGGRFLHPTAEHPSSHDTPPSTKNAKVAASILDDSIQLFDFYIYDATGDALLAAALRQMQSLSMMQRLITIFNKLSAEFSQTLASKQQVQNWTSQSNQSDLVGRSSAGNRARLIHPCLLQSRRAASTVLHTAIQLFDSRELVYLLATACDEALTVYDAAGFQPFHLACSLRRHKAVAVLIKLPTVDLNARTVDGQLPEDLTTSRRINVRLRHRRRNDASSLERPSGANQTLQRHHSGAGSLAFENDDAKSLSGASAVTATSFATTAGGYAASNWSHRSRNQRADSSGSSGRTTVTTKTTTVADRRSVVGSLGQSKVSSRRRSVESQSWMRRFDFVDLMRRFEEIREQFSAEDRVAAEAEATRVYDP